MSKLQLPLPPRKAKPSHEGLVAHVRSRLDLRQVSWWKVLRNLGIILAGMAILLGASLTGLNTPVGRRLLVQFATGLKLNSGLKIEIGSLDGSLYGNMTIHDLKLRDPKGVFLISPLVHLNWRPFGALNKQVDIRDLSSPKIELLRTPQFNPSQEQTQTGPLLPDLRIDVDRAHIEAFQIDAPVMGTAHSITFDGATHILNGRAQLSADAMSDAGDHLSIRLDAVPDANLLDMNAVLSAPKGSIVAGLAHLKTAFNARILGKGSWKQWQGRLEANLGENALLGFNLDEADGKFALKGNAYPDRILSGEPAGLLRPEVAIDLTTVLKKRTVTGQMILRSDAISLTAKGVMDLGRNHFNTLDAHLRLLKPDVLGKDFTASDLSADLLIDGDFGTPNIDYQINAKRLMLGRINLTGFTAAGKSRITSTGAVLPINAQLTSVSGIDSRIDQLLMHLNLRGGLTLNDGKLSSDTLLLTSDRTKITGKVIGDVTKNSYTANFKAGLNNYRVEEVGIVNVSTDAKLTFTQGHFSIGGTLSGQTTKLEDQALLSFLGGNARVTGGYAYADGAVSIRKLSGKAPNFTLINANGVLSSKGALAFTANARSKTYGPLDLVASGTLAKPQVVLHAASPGLGVGIVNLTANLNATQDGFVVKADGDSTYGPFNGDGLLITTKGPLVADIHQAHFAGIDISGRLTQSSKGPFFGTLAFSGSGLNGSALLSDLNGDQAAAVYATGMDIGLPGTFPVHIGRAIISTSVLLRDQPEIAADIQIADLHYADTVLATGRAKVKLIGQNGTFQAVAQGQKSVPFTIALNGQIAPDSYKFAAQGTLNETAFHLDHPAVVHKSGADWILSPAIVIMDQGKIELAGRFGDTLKAQMHLDHLDLSLANLFSTDLGVTGIADGTIDFSQTGSSFPIARANLKISHFSRTSAAVVSSPVDMILEACLDPDRSPSDNYVHAVVRQGGATVGRAQLALIPATTGNWMNDISAAQLLGGVRYNGPAEMPFSLTGLSRQSLSGPVALAADISGQIKAPKLNGVIKATGLTYDNDGFGTRITQLAIDGRFTSDRLEVISMSGKAGEGTVKASGWVSLAADQHFPMSLHSDLNNARLARSDSINSVVTGTLDITNNQSEGPKIKGDLRLPELKYVIVHQGAAEVNILDGVHKKGEDTAQLPITNSPPSLWKLDVRVRADNKIFVSGMGLESEWSMNLRLIGSSNDPRVDGSLKAIRGTYTFAGRSFNIDNGTIIFDGGSLDNPEIALTASADLQDISGIIKVSGTAQRPDITFSSTPALPQDEVLSRMLFGESVANISATEALQLASAVNGLSGGTDYLNPLGALRSATGIDRLRVVGADTATGRGTALAAGKYLTNNVYVEIVTDTKGFTATQIEVALSRALSILSQTGGTTGTSVKLRYSKDY